VASNQVCISLLDRRATEEMSALCLERGVRLMAYGTLGGGFLSERWLGAAEPAEVGDWSKMKYRRFIDAVGGWARCRACCVPRPSIGRKHGVSIANVATRWVLDQPARGGRHRRRAAGRARAPRRQPQALCLRAR
jgi:aryl-alcohol dehydrogenase-like predicted oxidoreductase